MDALDRPELDQVERGEGYLVGQATARSDLIKETELCGYFEGVNSLLTYIQGAMPEPRREGSSSKPRKQEGTFYTFDSYEEALGVYLTCPGSIREFDPSEVPLTDQDSAGNNLAYDVTGDFLDIGRYLEGEPECFGELTDGRPTGRRVNLYINLAWVFYVDSRIVNKRSRRIQRLVDWLESQGVRVRITGIRSSHTSHVELLIKDHDQILDVNDIAVVSNGDFLRRIIFRIDEYSQTWSSGYGSPTLFSDWMRKHPIHPEYNSELNVFIDNKCSDKTVDTEFDDLESWIEDRLCKIGVLPKRRYKAILTEEEPGADYRALVERYMPLQPSPWLPPPRITWA